MSDAYRLVFRGEVLEGQHPAVVRRRLGQAADFDEAVLDKLFSGRPVVLKRAADTATAARFQALFRKAGARLRVLPVEGTDEAGPESESAAPAMSPGVVSPDSGGAPPDAVSNDRAAPSASGLQLLPPGTDVLREDERRVLEPRDIDTGGLALEGARFVVPEAPAEPEGPDVSHLTVASVGSDLGPRRAQPEHPVQAPDFSIAAPGVDLAPAAAPSVPPVDLAGLQFEVAPVGSELGGPGARTVPAAPDVSHLRLSDSD